jgi:hypothetical protein
MRAFILVLFVFFIADSVFSQSLMVRGTVVDETTAVPVGLAAVRISGSSEGAITDAEGRFELKLKKIPVSLNISCLGYEPLYYDLVKNPSKPVRFLLKRKEYSLKEVNVKAQDFRFVYKDQSFSVLDYEIMDDKLLLLVFRCTLKNSELLLLETNGDTVARAPLPEQKPKCLFKDFLGNVHYISTKNNAFQCYYIEGQKGIGFPFISTYEILLKAVRPFLFSSGGRLYFAESTSDGFGMNFGYFDTLRVKHYIRTAQDEKARRRFYNDLKFNSSWNYSIQKNQQALSESPFSSRNNKQAPDNHEAGAPDLSDDQGLPAATLTNYSRIDAPMVKIGENDMAVFRFSEDVIEFMDKEGKVYHTIPIEFHKEDEGNILAGLLSVFVPISDWKWCGKIYTDEYFREVYTTFRKNGMVQIKKIDLMSGKLSKTFDVPYPFPEKIEIYKGNAYFLVKQTGGDFENWKLVRLKL